MLAWMIIVGVLSMCYTYSRRSAKTRESYREVAPRGRRGLGSRLTARVLDDGCFQTVSRPRSPRTTPRFRERA